MNYFSCFLIVWTKRSSLEVMCLVFGGQRDGVQQWELQSFYFSRRRNRWENLARGGWIPVKKKVTAERDRQHVRHILSPLPPLPSFCPTFFCKRVFLNSWIIFSSGIWRKTETFKIFVRNTWLLVFYCVSSFLMKLATFQLSTRHFFLVLFY